MSTGRVVGIMSMELHQIRYFLTLCETLNFTRAAEQCRVGQPSLTRAIKKLEEELGGALLRRERKQTHLTGLGHALYDQLKSIHETAEGVRLEARAFLCADRMPLKLGIMCTIGCNRMTDFFLELRRTIPSLNLILVEGSCEDLVRQLTKGHLDIALIAQPKYPDCLESRLLYRETYLVAFPRGHRFEAMETVPIDELSGEDYVLRLHCEFPAYFRALGVPKFRVPLNIRYRTSREDWLQAMVLAGLGCAVMPEFLPILPGLTTRVLVEPKIQREVHLVTVSGRPLSSATQALARLAYDYAWSYPTRSSESCSQKATLPTSETTVTGGRPRS